MLDNTRPAHDSTSLYRERALDWYGWQPSQRYTCPRSVLGNRCPSRSTHGYCNCLRGFELDHPAMWKDPVRSRIFLTWEPYEVTDLDQMRHVLAPMCLQVDELPRSMYWPNVTRLYAITTPTPTLPIVEARSKI